MGDKRREARQHPSIEGPVLARFGRERDSDTSQPLHVPLRHRLSAFLGESFGGSTTLVDVGDRELRDRASNPDVDPPLTLSNVTRAANRTTVLSDHGKHNSIAEV